MAAAEGAAGEGAAAGAAETGIGGKFLAVAFKYALPCTTPRRTSGVKVGTAETSETPRAFKALSLETSPNGGQRVSGFGACGDISSSKDHSSTGAGLERGSFALSAFFSVLLLSAPVTLPSATAVLRVA